MESDHIYIPVDAYHTLYISFSNNISMEQVDACCGLQYLGTQSLDPQSSGPINYIYRVINRKKFTQAVLKHAINYHHIDQQDVSKVETSIF